MTEDDLSRKITELAAREPDDLIAVTYEIDNCYELHGTIVTFVEAEVPPPPDQDSDEYEEWETEHVFNYTGTGNLDGDAGYFVRVVQSSDPERIKPGTTYEFV